MTQPPDDEGFAFLEPEDHLDSEPAHESAYEPAQEPALDPDETLVVPEDARRSQPGSRRADRPARRRGGCLPITAVAVVVLVVLAFAGYTAIGKVHHLFSGGPADYTGAGTGSVVFQVRPGDTASAIGAHLESEGVVKSVGAFVDAARSDSRSRGIQVGYYQLKEHMKASSALAVLVDPKNLVQAVVTVPEGARVRDIVKTIVAKTKITRAAVISALEHPSQIGLPAEAKGNPEGYLFPATYTVPPGETAVQLVRQMVEKAVSEYESLDVAAGARARGLSTEQLITVASILQYEASRNQDYPRVARAIYNRLAKGMRLQSDATVSYANGVSGQIWTSAAQRSNASPYNTYQHGGLPPGPIGNPGVQTLKAAMHPANGPWLFWVVVNLRTGETVMSTTLAQHEQAVQQFRDYCKTSTAC